MANLPVHVKGANQAHFRDGGSRRMPDAGADPTDAADYRTRYSSAGHGPGARERRLMLAVLEDALDTVRKYAGASDPRQRALYHHARAWFTACEAEWPFAFAPICEALGLDPDYVRAGVLRGCAASQARQRHAGVA